jgi:hypothetical protein
MQDFVRAMRVGVRALARLPDSHGIWSGQDGCLAYAGIQTLQLLFPSGGLGCMTGHRDS